MISMAEDVEPILETLVVRREYTLDGASPFQGTEMYHIINYHSYKASIYKILLLLFLPSCTQDDA